MMTDRALAARWWIIAVLLLVGAAGFFGPWAPHRASALAVLGIDLAEYVKFLPPVMSGEIGVHREAFFVPLTVASMACSLLASRRALPTWARLVLVLSAIVLAGFLLPPAWTPDSLRLPEFRDQVLALLACLAAVALLPLIRRLPDRAILAMLALGALTAAIWPPLSFLQVRPAIAAIWQRSFNPGWGFWLSLLSSIALAACALSGAVRPTHRCAD